MLTDESGAASPGRKEASMQDTIFMIHGAWNGPWSWSNYKGFFEERGYRCITPVLRFHDGDAGSAPDPRLGETSLLDYAGDLEREIGELGEKPILMGHSMGGLLSLILAARGLASRAVLLTPAPPAGTVVIPKISGIRSVSQLGLLSFKIRNRPVRPSFEGSAHVLLNLMPASERRAIYDRFIFESGRALFELLFWRRDRGKAAWVDRQRMTCPLLCIAGAQDRLSQAWSVRRIAKQYRSVATYREFPDHAHWVLAEPGWQNITGFIADWLSQASM
jgi:pimeloyl-ACP methyl ester carboxylesterase